MDGIVSDIRRVLASADARALFECAFVHAGFAGSCEGGAAQALECFLAGIEHAAAQDNAIRERAAACDGCGVVGRPEDFAECVGVPCSKMICAECNVLRQNEYPYCKECAAGGETVLW